MFKVLDVDVSWRITPGVCMPSGRMWIVWQRCSAIAWPVVFALVWP